MLGCVENDNSAAWEYISGRRTVSVHLLENDLAIVSSFLSRYLKTTYFMLHLNNIYSTFIYVQWED